MQCVWRKSNREKRMRRENAIKEAGGKERVSGSVKKVGSLRTCNQGGSKRERKK